MEEGELRGDIEGRDGEVELVNESQSLVDRVYHLVEILFRIIGRRCRRG